MDVMCNPPHPGEVIVELCLCGRAGQEAADLLGVSLAYRDRLLAGKSQISPQMALRLEAAGWSNAEYWMRLQAAFDLDLERNRQRQAA